MYVIITSVIACLSHAGASRVFSVKTFKPVTRAVLSPYGMHLSMYKLHIQSSHPMECSCQCTNCICNPLTIRNAFVDVQIAYAILSPCGMHLSMYKLHMQSSHPMECICQCTNCICNPLTLCKSFVNVQIAYAILSPYANHLSM